MRTNGHVTHLVACAIAVAATTGCGPDFPPTLEGLPTIPAIEAFPCDSATNVARDSESIDRLTGNAVQANEIHDCQRLVWQGQYGPLVGIFPITSAMTVEDAAFSPPGLVVASIYNWDAEPYLPLGIGVGLSCLVITRDSTGGGWWDAAIVQPSQGRCVQKVPQPGGPSTHLQVRRTGYDSLPATARWGWDHTPQGQTDASQTHFIGIKCGVGWCSIGLNGFDPAQPDLGAAPSEAPGWYDEQHLAVSSDGTLVPGPWGRIRPNPQLAGWRVSDYAQPRQVSTVRLAGSQAERDYYASKYGYSATGESQIWLAHTTADDDPGQWVMSIRPTSTTAPAIAELTIKVDRIPQLHAVKGAVRWRWSTLDERNWTPCDEGCCTPTENLTGT